MCFNFAFSFYVTLSSADNPFKQFGPWLGPTFCPDLIGVLTVWQRIERLWQVGVKPMFYFFMKPLHDFVSRWHLRINVSNTLDPDQAQHSVWTWSGSNLFDTLEVMKRWIEPMYFNHEVNLNVLLSSADNPFKSFGPRSGLTYCPHLIGVKTNWHFRGYDKLKLNRCILTLT